MEKNLKALMSESSLTIPKTHDLDLLRSILLSHYPSLRPLRRGLTFLTDFAVDTWNPGANASKRQAKAAPALAQAPYEPPRALLKIR